MHIQPISLIICFFKDRSQKVHSLREILLVTSRARGRSLQHFDHTTVPVLSFFTAYLEAFWNLSPRVMYCPKFYTSASRTWDPIFLARISPNH